MVKLSPRFIGPFEVLDRVVEVSYRLTLPHLSGVHMVFYVSMLQKYNEDKSHVLDYNTVLLDENLAYEEESMAILDRQVRKLREISVDPPADQVQDQFINDHVETPLPPQHLEGFVAAPVFQEAIAEKINFTDALTQVGVVPMAPTISQARVGVQTSTTRTPK
ncbi:PREDICTED: uncharacterized protein LOC109230321 [Nicotiana attenuata]|uniref:uncharacterized protein LOC109230321 n=1 Tax=Nicotiana attenuata TaxID=49451 RepID=UPI0009055ABD|nr:PREDICTED: uncharacterized protein LOC109230321 [Nicotiana attenuata]